MRLKRLVVGLVGLGLALVFASAPAQAALIIGQDDDIEFVFSYDPNTGALTPKTSGTLAVGDVFVSTFELPSLSVDGVSQITEGVNEVTGLAVSQIVDITGNTVTFAPFVEGFNAISPVDVADGDAGEGAIVAIFRNDLNIDLEFDPAVNLATNCTSFAQCIAEATEGELLQVDGFAGDLDEFFIGTALVPGGLDVGVIAGGAPTVPFASFFAALTTFENNIPAPGTPIGFQFIFSGLPCPGGSFAADGCVAGPTLSGQILGGRDLNPDLNAFARSDFDAQKLTQVPAPGTLALIGIGLLGFAVTTLRRRQ